jgi:hypothetical protein
MLSIHKIKNILNFNIFLKQVLLIEPIIIKFRQNKNQKKKRFSFFHLEFGCDVDFIKIKKIMI